MDLVQKIIALTNQERANHGLRSLEWNEQLFKAAQEHSQSMANGDFFDRRELVERAREEGYPSRLLSSGALCVKRTTPIIEFSGLRVSRRVNASKLDLF